MNIRYQSLLLVLSIFSFGSLLAQPINDDCEQAIELSNVSNYCSGKGEFTNVAATETNPNNPSCWPQFSTVNDVWFSFTAQATDVSITVIGNTAGNIPSGGTLDNPQFALYQGDCSGVLTEVQCASDGFNFNVVESLAGPLNIGQTYYIRVAARNNNTGTFQLCVNNFNEIPDPSSDCNTGVVLCDKSPFTVESISGTGSNTNEIANSSCIQTEHGSAWYKWTCDVAGTLSFTLTPNNPSDDLDFVVFELPSGIDNCDDKIEIRCMASGEQVGAPLSVWEPCTGATGLSLGSSDTAEFPGCQAGDDNFVAAIDMEVGKSYALIVDNFSNTGSGFAVEFGGTGTFLGPTADFISDFDEICLNDLVTITDNSTSVSGIDEWEWNFGNGSNPTTIVGEGPHEVDYSTAGLKSIVLKLTSQAGCIVTHIENITVLPVPELTIETSADYCDPAISTGDVSAIIQNGVEPLTYDWNNTGVFVSDSTLVDIPTGNYTVTVRDGNGCESELDFFLLEGLALESSLDPVQPPTCNGDTDGSISVTVEIGNNPITYEWEGNPTTGNTLNGIGAGTYSVTVTDGTGCSGEFDIEVDDFPVLEADLDGVDISCFGETDGSVLSTPMGGSGGYSFNWNNNSSNEEIVNLPAGNYILTLTDDNGCTTVENVIIEEPPELFLDLDDSGDVVCHGDTTGFVSVSASGGTPSFEFSVDGVQFQTQPDFNNLPAGNYTVIIRDSRGCTEEVQAFIDQPSPLIVEAGEDQTIELGYTANINAVHTPPFRPVTWSWTNVETLDCPDCNDPIARPFQTTNYVVTIEDETGCRSLDSLTINVIKNYPIYIPNAFSPNNDGINDGFTIYGGPAVQSIKSLKIFSRWGSMVFEGSNLDLGNENMGWNGVFNGKKMNPAVFAYLAEIEFIDGEIFLFKGDVTLMR
ncbi:MAG: gliding motility-associated C-terminal domain-containing protein [Saprospiraceae bacterium]|jgi:gliding motility-associated-like protein|nr:gliding motility-associated C-terminal domain-containing protein [Saprospiraceae bacterium]